VELSLGFMWIGFIELPDSSYTFFCRISKLVSDEDLKFLIENLEEETNDSTEIWEHVIHKSNDRISYSAKRCKPKVVTYFQKCLFSLLLF